MEDRNARKPEETAKAREPLFSKSTVAILAIFLALNIVGITIMLAPWKSKDEGKGPAAANPLDESDAVSLGRVEVTRSMDPLQENLVRFQATVTLIMPTALAPEYVPKIRKFEDIFKEEVRQSFRDADIQDLRTENCANVKNAIRNRVNQKLGAEVVRDVAFGDYKIF